MSGLEDLQVPRETSTVGSTAERGTLASGQTSYEQAITGVSSESAAHFSLQRESALLLGASLTHLARLSAELEHTSKITVTSDAYLDVAAELERRLDIERQAIGGFERGSHIRVSGENFFVHPDTAASGSKALMFRPTFRDQALSGTVGDVRIIPVLAAKEWNELHAHFRDQRVGIATPRPEQQPLDPWGVGIEIHRPQLTSPEGIRQLAHPTAIIPLNYSPQIYKAHPQRS